jgi:nitroimidazol reductase NimA-like FMN-containing flavoprotein (pyridoxamine 5'-phosphate oxidase superfamily)
MARTTITRLRTKASRDRGELDSLLDSVHIGHFALVAEDGHPVVLPTAVARDGDRVLAHGSTGSGWIRRLAAGTPTSLAVTSFDALVVARSAFESSMHYRSAVIFGQCTSLTDPDEKLRALDTIIEALLPGRLAEVRHSTRKELAKTLVVALPITEWSLKVSDGWPAGRLRRAGLGRRDPGPSSLPRSRTGAGPARRDSGPRVSPPDKGFVGLSRTVPGAALLPLDPGRDDEVQLHDDQRDNAGDGTDQADQCGGRVERLSDHNPPTERSHPRARLLGVGC